MKRSTKSVKKKPRDCKIFKNIFKVVWKNRIVKTKNLKKKNLLTLENQEMRLNFLLLIDFQIFLISRKIRKKQALTYLA